MGTQTPDEVVARIRELRDILDVPVEAAAAKLGVSPEVYREYESGERPIPINSLYGLAELFKTDVTVLLTGEPPRMAGYTVVRAGKGAHVERYEGYQFESLASNFIRRTLEPMLVTIEPHEDEAHEPALVSHHGQEFNYVLEGSVRVKVGKGEFVLNAGDSIYFDATQMHGQRAVGGKAKFLTIIEN
ncbi:MAG: cupin domain-containing protein [Kiritimatiellae bacterium]|nr:cupin domain-containing protein [Kiritimatiellia bacterium]